MINQVVVGSSHGDMPKYAGEGVAIFCGCTSDALHLKCIILFSDVTSLKGAVTSQRCTCIGHVTFYYKRSADASVGGSDLLFIRSSGSTLSPETHVWLVPNVCRLRHI